MELLCRRGLVRLRAREPIVEVLLPRELVLSSVAVVRGAAGDAAGGAVGGAVRDAAGELEAQRKEAAKLEGELDAVRALLLEPQLPCAVAVRPGWCS